MTRIAKSYRWFIQPLLVVGILVFGFIGAMSFNLFEEQPDKIERPTYAPLVEVISPQPTSRMITLESNGSIQAHTRIDLVTQVGGRIDYIHPQLRSGGLFKADEVLLKIEALDYQLAVTQNEAEVAAARTALELEKAEAEAAREEWLSLNPAQSIPPLVGRQPQIEEATAQLDAAKARLAKAKLDLTRTQLKLPFDGRVVSSSIDIGSVVNANQSVGSVYSTHSFEIPVPLELDELAWIQLQPNSTHQSVSRATITIPIGQQHHKIPASISRIDSVLDERSRFARAILTISSNDIPPLIRHNIVPGLFVQAEIEAQQLHEVSVVPRNAFHSEDTLWLVSDNHLQIIKPNIIFRTRDEFIVSPLPPNVEVVISELDVVTDGMEVRVAGQPE